MAKTLFMQGIITFSISTLCEKAVRPHKTKWKCGAIYPETKQKYIAAMHTRVPLNVITYVAVIIAISISGVATIFNVFYNVHSMLLTSATGKLSCKWIKASLLLRMLYLIL